MQYLGGKSRLAKRFAHVLDDALLDARAGRFVEPFVGGFNVVPAILPTPALCADVHPGLVALYDGLQAGTFDPPHSLTEDEYRALREECDWSNPLTAFLAGLPTGARIVKVRPLFAWYDLWVGFYWDQKERRLYFLPLPCLGVVIQFP